MKIVACLMMGAGLLASGAVWGQGAPTCEANYNQTGSFIAGRTFTTWGVVKATPQVAFKKIYRGVVKAGLLVVNSNLEMGTLSLEQPVSVFQAVGDNIQSKIVWSVVVESEQKGSKISVTKVTPEQYSTSRSFEIKSLCSIVTTADAP